MEDFISNIYYYAQIIPATKEIIDKCYESNDTQVVLLWDEIKILYLELLKTLNEYDSNLSSEILNNIESACSFVQASPRQFNLMGNILEDTLPLLYKAISFFGHIDIEDRKYRLLSSKSGYLTLYNLETKRYYHDLIDPYHEAYRLAQRIYDPINTSYRFLGCGLGYLPWQIFCISDMSAEIYIYHNDYELIQYAVNYGVLSYIPENKLHVIINNNIDSLLDAYESSSKEDFFFYDTHDVFDSANQTQKQRINISNITSNGTFLFEKQLTINLWKNIKNIQNHFSEFKDFIPNAPWIVVAAGPSLDSNINYLKLNVGKKNIICASTVLKKLLDLEITPTCVAVLDPQSRTFRHFNNLDLSVNIPLILASTGNWQFSEYYQGPKYYIPSYTDTTSVLYFLAKDEQSFDLSSTVSGMAIILALQYGAKSIELIGVDLSFPTGYSHANGTMDCKPISNNNLFEVPAVNGGTVLTNQTFLFYSKQINKLIHDNPQTEFINFSDNGIKFDNCKWYKDCNV